MGRNFQVQAAIVQTKSSEHLPKLCHHQCLFPTFSHVPLFESASFYYQCIIYYYLVTDGGMIKWYKVLYHQVHTFKEVFTVSNKYLSNNEKFNHFTQQKTERSTSLLQKKKKDLCLECDHKVPKKSCASDKTGILCVKCYSDVL